jgi:MscS family membrane protein
MTRALMWLAGALFALLLALPAAAAPPVATECGTPRAAADSIFVWQRTESYDLAKAARCLDVPPGGKGQQLAVQLRQVLDARALYVPVSSLPSDPNYVNEDGESIVVPMPDAFPILVLERAEDGRWLYARETVAAIPNLYQDTFSGFSLWFQSQLPEQAYVRVLGLQVWQLIYAVLLLALAWLVGRIVQALLRGQVIRVVDRLGLEVDKRAYRRTQFPMVVVSMAAVLAWGLPDLQLPIALSRATHLLVDLMLDLGGIFLITGVIDIGSQIAQSWTSKTESRLDDQLIPMLRQASRVLVLVLGTLLIFDDLGVDVWKLVAGVGIGGLAFALAAQDTVANVFGSINIFVDKPFQIGDWIKVGEVEGTVEEVGFRSTRVRTFYNSLVTIPNSKITNANVDNLGVRPRRRVKLTVGLTYDTPPDKVQAYVEGVRAILAAHPFVQRTYEVHFYNLGGSALEILVYYHVVVANWSEELETRAQNLLEFVRLAEQLGVSFAFPSTSVYLESTPDRPLTPQEQRSVAELQALAASFGPNGANARPSGVPFTESWSVQGRTDRGAAGE